MEASVEFVKDFFYWNYTEEKLIILICRYKLCLELFKENVDLLFLITKAQCIYWCYTKHLFIRGFCCRAFPKKLFFTKEKLILNPRKFLVCLFYFISFNCIIIFLIQTITVTVFRVRIRELNTIGFYNFNLMLFNDFNKS